MHVASVTPIAGGLVDQPLGPDELLLTELGELLDRLSPPPAWVARMAKDSYTWHTIDAELAGLTGDSLSEGRPRGAAAARLLTFQASDLVVELEVDVWDRGRRILGQLIPPQPARIEVRQSGATRTVAADASGRFTIWDLEARPVSLRCHLARRVAWHDPVVTEWVGL
jgi:hypothetical protein